MSTHSDIRDRSDYEEMSSDEAKWDQLREREKELERQLADMREQLAAAESKEVCTVAHSDEVMEFCPYCKIEALQAECADLIAGKEYQAMQRTLVEVNVKFVKVWEKLAEAVALLELWHDGYGTIPNKFAECLNDDTTTFLHFLGKPGTRL